MLFIDFFRLFLPFFFRIFCRKFIFFTEKRGIYANFVVLDTGTSTTGKNTGGMPVTFSGSGVRNGRRGKASSARPGNILFRTYNKFFSQGNSRAGKRLGA